MASKFKLSDLITPREHMGAAYVGILYRIISYNESTGNFRLMENDQHSISFEIRLRPWKEIENNFDVVTSPNCFNPPEFPLEIF